MKSNGIKFKVCTKFRGSVNGAEFEVIEIKKSYATIIASNGKKYTHAISYLQHLLVTEI